MKAIDRLSDRHVLALGKFIVGCVRVRQSRHWRSHLVASIRRNSFVPFVQNAENNVLRDLLARHSETSVCGLSTSQILLAANQVAREWGEPLLKLDTSPRPEGATASG